MSTHNLHNLSAWRVQTEDKIKFQTDAEKNVRSLTVLFTKQWDIHVK